MKKRLSSKILSCVLSMAIMLSMMSGLFSVEVGAATVITSAQVDAAVTWALNMNERAYFDDGSSVYFECPRFVRDAFVAAGLTYLPTRNARMWGDMWTVSTNLNEVPPKGALTFYDYWSNGVNYGHVALSLGDGRVISALQKVKITDYKMSSYTNLTYTGWGVYNGYSLSSDTIAPTITSAKFEEVHTSSMGVYVKCTASDNVGISKICFDAWVNDSYEATTVWYTGNLEGNTAWFYVPASDFNVKVNKYSVCCYAYDTAGNYAQKTIECNIEHANVPTKTKATIKDGVYALQNGSSNYMDVYNANNASGTNLVEWDWVVGSNQLFKFVHQGGGKYLIYPQCATDKVLSIRRGNGSLDQEDELEINANNDNDAQLFYVVPLDDGGYALELASKDNYVIGGRQNVSISKLHLQSYVSNSLCQRWYFKDTNGNAVDPSLKTFENVTISSIPAQPYTGSKIQPAVTVKDGSKTLVKDTDYTVAYSNNINVGTATVKITGKGNYSGTKTANFEIILSKPTNVKANAGDGAVTLTWKTVAGATNYVVYSNLNGKYTNQGTTTSTSKTIKGLTNGTKYGFLVKALINGTWTPYTNADLVYATPYALAKPTATVKAGNGQVTLTWKAIAGAANYVVYSNLNGKYTNQGTTTSTSKTIKGLTNGTKYGFLVKALINGTWTPYTNADLVYATPYALTKPTVTAKAGNGQVTLTWKAIAGATNYVVYSNLNGKYTNQGTTTSTSKTIKGLTNGTKYGFLVKALINGTWTPYTNADLVYATPYALTKPAVTAKAGNGQVTLTWKAVAGATNYVVYSNLNGKYINQGTTTSTSKTIKGLTNGTKYGFLVKALINGIWTPYTNADLVYATPV